MASEARRATSTAVAISISLCGGRAEPLTRPRTPKVSARARSGTTVIDPTSSRSQAARTSSLPPNAGSTIAGSTVGRWIGSPVSSAVVIGLSSMAARTRLLR